MVLNIRVKKQKATASVVLILASILLLAGIAAHSAYAIPSAPTVTTVSNATKAPDNGTSINSTGSGQSSGGYLFTVILDGLTQNTRWKAYLGNVTGKLTLDDANSFTIYDWTISGSPSGEVYAARSSGTINWSGVACSYLNTTTKESLMVNQTGIDDNVTRTFNDTAHAAFSVGAVSITANSCPSTHTYINDTRNANNSGLFAELLLYDGGAAYNFNTSVEDPLFKNIIYTTVISPDAIDYRKEMADFQILLPERGYATWTSSTAYYFYVELS